MREGGSGVGGSRSGLHAGTRRDPVLRSTSVLQSSRRGMQKNLWSRNKQTVVDRQRQGWIRRVTETRRATGILRATVIRVRWQNADSSKTRQC